MKKYYLLKVWQPSRGTSYDNPAYYSGPGNYYLHHPLTKVNPACCYTSEKRAQRVADKYNASLWVRHQVVEVPDDILDASLMTSSKLWDALRNLTYPQDKIDAAIHYLVMSAGYDEIQSISTPEDVESFLLAHS